MAVASVTGGTYKSIHNNVAGKTTKQNCDGMNIKTRLIKNLVTFLIFFGGFIFNQHFLSFCASYHFREFCCPVHQVLNDGIFFFFSLLLWRRGDRNRRCGPHSAFAVRDTQIISTYISPRLRVGIVTMLGLKLCSKRKMFSY
jgi:hypothetical protein